MIAVVCRSSHAEKHKPVNRSPHSGPPQIQWLIICKYFNTISAPGRCEMTHRGPRTTTTGHGRPGRAIFSTEMTSLHVIVRAARFQFAQGDFHRRMQTFFWFIARVNLFDKSLLSCYAMLFLPWLIRFQASAIAFMPYKHQLRRSSWAKRPQSVWSFKALSERKCWAVRLKMIQSHSTMRTHVYSGSIHDAGPNDVSS